MTSEEMIDQWDERINRFRSNNISCFRIFTHGASYLDQTFPVNTIQTSPRRALPMIFAFRLTIRQEVQRVWNRQQSKTMRAAATGRNCSSLDAGSIAEATATMRPHTISALPNSRRESQQFQNPRFANPEYLIFCIDFNDSSIDERTEGRQRQHILSQ